LKHLFEEMLVHVRRELQNAVEHVDFSLGETLMWKGKLLVVIVKFY